MKKYFYIFLFVLSIKIKAQDTSHLSLEQVFQKIESSYPEIIMYESAIKSLLAQSEAAKAWMPPVASLGLDRFPYRLSNLRMKEDPMNQAGLMFSLEQMILNSSKLKAKQNYISSLATVQQTNAEWTKNILRTRAKLFYYQRYIAEKKLKVVGENIGLLDLFISTAEERYKYNQSDLSTIYKARARLAELQNMKSMLLSEIEESNIGLNTLMNRAINFPFGIDSVVSLHTYEVFLTDTSAIKRNDIASIDNSIQSMKLNQAWMASWKKPDFGMKIQHMQMFGMPPQFTLMGMVTIPVVPWSAGMYKSEVKSMGFQIEAMQKEKETMNLMAMQMIIEKLTVMKFGKEQLKNYENEIIPAYRKNMETSLLAYKQNTGSFFVLLDAWDMLLMKQMEYLGKFSDVLKLEAGYEYETEKK